METTTMKASEALKIFESSMPEGIKSTTAAVRSFRRVLIAANGDKNEIKSVIAHNKIANARLCATHFAEIEQFLPNKIEIDASVKLPREMDMPKEAESLIRAAKKDGGSKAANIIRSCIGRYIVYCSQSGLTICDVESVKSSLEYYQNVLPKNSFLQYKSIMFNFAEKVDKKAGKQARETIKKNNARKTKERKSFVRIAQTEPGVLAALIEAKDKIDTGRAKDGYILEAVLAGIPGKAIIGQNVAEMLQSWGHLLPESVLLSIKDRLRKNYSPKDTINPKNGMYYGNINPAKPLTSPTTVFKKWKELCIVAGVDFEKYRWNE